ncbi:hypothetical protein [Actinospica robiniae]|uniref:hypothetical protein n=1 Tax=Actinospica robiniae TaxID=304901 RepID=UPI000427C49A|nr:hypothetical protein [Actinospica robiniae]
MKHLYDARPADRVLGETPRRLKLLAAELTALSVLIGTLYVLALSGDATSFARLQARTTEVSATGDLYYELDDMDAQAADALLVGFHPTDPSMVPVAVDAAASAAAYQHDRSAADADLALIARNPQLTVQAEKLMDGLGDYEALIAQALYVDQGTQNEKPAAPPAASLGSYTQASSLLHAKLLPASLKIADADSAAVDASYSGDRADATGYGYAVLGLALATASAMMLGNRYHARRFRRRLSWLAGGAVVCLVLGFLGLATQSHAAEDLEDAKKNAYDSINALTRAKAVSDDANGDESRWLLEGRTPALQASFFQNVSSVAALPDVSSDAASSDPQAYYSGLSSAVSAVHLDAAANSISGVQFGGYLGAESGNITFPGEGQAAYDAAQAFNAYLQDDAAIRADAGHGDLAAAVALDIGTRPGQSNYTFGQYMAKLAEVIQINDTGFSSGVSAGESETDAASWTTMLVGEALLLMAIARSAHVRLREYQ